MKKIIIGLLFLVLSLISYSAVPRQVYAASCNSTTIVDTIFVSPTTVNAGEVITIEVLGAFQLNPGSYYIALNYSILGGLYHDDAHAYIIINEEGNGSVQITIPTSLATGSYSLAMLDAPAIPFTACSVINTVNVINDSPEPPPPPPPPGCVDLRVGDGCSGFEVICDPELYCHEGIGIGGGNVVNRRGSENAYCRLEGSNYVCDSGHPSSQDSSCRCLAEEGPPYAPYLCYEHSVPLMAVDTAFGCIPIISVNTIATFFVKWGVRFVGGFAFLLILFATMMIIVSTGDPERLRAGRELLNSAIAGVLLIIFAIFILRFIGFNLLGIFS